MHQKHPPASIVLLAATLEAKDSKIVNKKKNSLLIHNTPPL